jgi:hypothetical protein
MADIYFSDYFGVPPEALQEWGLLDVSLVGDLPLFVDPFLLFNSTDETYQRLHTDIIRYMRFLKDVTLARETTPALVASWFTFPEIKQNWLGWSMTGNQGRGLGSDFAKALHNNFPTVFRDFGQEQLTRSSHLEKLCLIRNGVGRDMISDFTTNLIKPHLAGVTEAFAQRFLGKNQRRRFAVPKVSFNYETRSWMSQTFELPLLDGDYVLLTPKDILTKDEAWINRPELIDRFRDIAEALPDDQLRAQINDYFRRALPRRPTAEETREAAANTIERFPQVLDYYIRDKEERGEEAVARSRTRVDFVEAHFISLVREFANSLLEPIGFYNLGTNTYDEAMKRLLYLKDVIENKGGHRLFYQNGAPIQRESDLQIIYRFTWYATPSDVSREVNDGRGPADFKISRGARDKTIVEFKLAKNTKLEQNLANQAELYAKASDATHPSIKAIVYFSDAELQRVHDILKRLKLQDSPHIVLIDADSSNKPSASRALSH